MGKFSRDIEWRTVAVSPVYEVSEYGDVRRRVAGRTRFAGHVLKGHWHNGYRSYKLMLPDGTKRSIGAHRLVAWAFHGSPPSPDHCAAHNDGNSRNNHYTNLRWATHAENQGDVRRHGTRKGALNGRSRLTDDDVREIRSKFTGKYGQVAALAREYDVAHTTMLQVVHRTHWRHVDG